MTDEELHRLSKLYGEFSNTERILLNWLISDPIVDVDGNLFINGLDVVTEVRAISACKKESEYVETQIRPRLNQRICHLLWLMYERAEQQAKFESTAQM